MNCADCSNVLIRKLKDEGREIVCAVDGKDMARYSMTLLECNRFREAARDGKTKKEKGQSPKS